MDPDPLPQFLRVEIPKLFNISDWQHTIPWQPFEEGVEVHRLYGDGITGPTAALLRFHGPGKVPAHSHGGYEHIIVLAGSQRDQNSTVSSGTLIINPPNSEHSIVSEDGCIVLAIYEKPVSFLAVPTPK